MIQALEDKFSLTRGKVCVNLVTIHWRVISFRTCSLRQEGLMQYMDIRFPHLGIVFSQVPRSFHIGSFEVMFYGLIVASAFFLGFMIARLEAVHTGQ